MGRSAAARQAARNKVTTQEAEWSPLPGFLEVQPNIWFPANYRPTPYELPPPIIKSDKDSAREYIECQESLAHFAFYHAWSLHTDDPSGQPTYRKIPTYPYLVDFFHQVQEPSNVHIEKSRQLLMSWAWMTVFLWDIIFHDTWGNLAISRKESYVDDGGDSSTTDSLFGKLRVVWMGLPPYLRHRMEFKRNLVTCLDTGSYCKGEAPTKRAGRGATYKRAILDEAAHIEHSESLFRSVRQAAKEGLILNSTPLGKGNVFSRIRYQPNTTFQRLSYHWTEHPDRSENLSCMCGWEAETSPGAIREIDQFDTHPCTAAEQKLPRKPTSPWYLHATADYTADQVASEFDLSYEKSMRGRVFEVFDEARHVVTLIGDQPQKESFEQYHERYLRRVLKPDLDVVCGWDFGVGDPTVIHLGQVVSDLTMKIRWLDTFSAADASWRHYAEFINGLWARVVKQKCHTDIHHYGDPSGRGRGSDLSSWVSNLRNYRGRFCKEGIPITTGPKVGVKLEWLDFIGELLRRDNFEVSLWCTELIDALGQYHFPLDQEGNPVPGKHLPVHDEWSHPIDAMQYVYSFRFAHRLKRVDDDQGQRKRMLVAGRGWKPSRPRF